MPKPRCTDEQRKAIISQSVIVKTLCEAEQIGHREVLDRLRILRDRMGLKPLFWTPDERMAVSFEMEWRQDQIKILELDRNAAHNAIKYHTKFLEQEEQT